MFVVSIVSILIRHVVAHSFQLHGGSKQIELVQAGHVAVEGLLRAWFKSLVHQGIIDP